MLELRPTYAGKPWGQDFSGCLPVAAREQFRSRSNRKSFPVTDWSCAIVAVARTRDRKQFSLLFSYFAPRLKAFFMRRGVSPAQAEDLAQEAMLAVWNKAHYFDPSRAAASTWIFTIARNLHIDHKRRERDPRLLVDEFDLTPEPMPSDHILSAERDERVRSVLMCLPSEQADVVRLSFFEDRPQSEIARVLDIPLGTVKSRIRLALSRLRALMEDRQ